jgi:hypothetical protein
MKLHGTRQLHPCFPYKRSVIGRFRRARRRPTFAEVGRAGRRTDGPRAQCDRDEESIVKKAQTISVLPEMVQLLIQEPDAPALVQAFVDAAAWAAGTEADALPEQRQRIAAEFSNLQRLEREIRELRRATETRWDGRSSAFLQADAVALADEHDWIDCLRRLAMIMTEVRGTTGR